MFVKSYRFIWKCKPNVVLLHYEIDCLILNLYKMKVNLIKEANYDLNELRSSKIPFDTFLKMCGAADKKEEMLTEELPNVRIFASIDDFKALSLNAINKFDNTKDVYILSNGNFCVFMKDDDVSDVKTNAATKTIEKKTVEKNATTSTKKNTESEATDLV